MSCLSLALPAGVQPTGVHPAAGTFPGPPPFRPSQLAAERLRRQGVVLPDAAAALERCGGDEGAALVWAARCLDSGGAAAVAQAEAPQRAEDRCRVLQNPAELLR